MSATPPVNASPSAGRWRWVAACHSRWHSLTPLGRDIIVILIAKAIVLALIWFAFFREPAAPQMAMEPNRVELRLLAPSPAPEVPNALR
jgi:hypothetical protein